MAELRGPFPSNAGTIFNVTLKKIQLKIKKLFNSMKTAYVDRSQL